MKKYLLIFIIIISSCSPNNNFQLNGNIKGLKKGTVILTKSIKGAEVTLDSINLNGTSKFTLGSYLNEPEVLKIKLTQSGIHNDEIEFFADKGITNFKTNLKRFSYESNFDGSDQQEKLDDFKTMLIRFKEENLNLIKNQIEFSGNQEKLNIINRELINLKKREMYFIINFSINNNDSEISPYIAGKFLNDANQKYLDTIYNSLSKNIKESKYGVLLEGIIDTEN
ncbi:MAG: DUF4369 domain-containing protein [Flavobacteriales bacterium]|nr:MAG: DUF4369 domain-containing protein [Flavobacteriales bacterium]